jgi:uncharacterized repeat protein (TIGR02543 family)
MGISLSSPTTYSQSNFKSTSDLSNIYDGDVNSKGMVRNGGSTTGTLTLSGLKERTSVGGLTGVTMPSTAIITDITAIALIGSAAITDPTGTLSLLEGSTSLNSTTFAIGGAINNPEQFEVKKSYSTSDKKNLAWLKNLKLKFTHKGNYSLSSSNSDTYIFEIVYYVTWKNSCVVTLDPNGGNVSPTSLTFYEGDKYETLPTPTREGYTFNYWMKEDGTRIYSTTTISSSHTLYAKWTANYYTLTTIANPPEGGEIGGNAGGSADF